MAPSPSADLDVLFGIADASILAGLDGRRPPLPRLDDLPAPLREPRGAFVTITVDGELNGCIGNIEASEPLAHVVARHAWSAAFADPRLPRLTRADHARARIELSILSPLAPIPASTRHEVLAAVAPGRDGLVLSAAGRSSVFLPSVWAQLPDPEQFVAQLLRKAGLDPSRWPPDMQAWRFTAEKHARPAGSPVP